MRLTLLPEDRRLELGFNDPEEARCFFEKARDEHGFLLHLEHRLRPFESICLAVSAGTIRFETTAEVMQLFPGPGSTGTAFKLTDADSPLAALSDGASEDAPPRSAGRRAIADGERSPMFRIKTMNPNERFRLAGKASRPERQILLRDTSPQVLLGLLNHPRIEDAEVLDVVKSNYASAGVLQRIADNRRWMSIADIRSAVVRSPKTPPQIAIKHLDGLSTRELGVLAKGSSSRELLRKAALKLYLKRTGHRGI